MSTSPSNLWLSGLFFLPHDIWSDKYPSPAEAQSSQRFTKRLILELARSWNTPGRARKACGYIIITLASLLISAPALRMTMSLRAPEGQPTKNTLRALRLCGRLTEKVGAYYRFLLWNEYHSIFRIRLFSCPTPPFHQQFALIFHAMLAYVARNCYLCSGI